MSGHSKWNNIKRTKEKTDAQKGKIFTKLGREIAVAIKIGGGDPETNNRLQDAILKAKQNNMPNDSIMRAIKKASGSGEGENFEEVVYEGYGIGGVAVMVKTLTDNKNRTASDVRHAFDKYGGSLGSNGCVSYLFSKKGLIIIDKSKIDINKLFETAIEVEIEDIEEYDDSVEITTLPEKLSYVAEFLKNADYNVLSFSIEQIPSIYIQLDEQKRATFEKMLERLEELDDVQDVFHNAENY